MERYFLDDLQALFEAGRYEELAERILALEHWKEDYELTGALARAFNNLERYEDALAVLDITAQDAGEDGYWHFRRGYAFYNLERIQEAAAEFQETVRLLPKDPDAWQYLQWCYEQMGEPAMAEQAEQHRKQLLGEEVELIPGEVEAATQFLLSGGMRTMFETKDEREGNEIVLPAWNLRLRPQVMELKEHSALLYLHLFHPDWDRTIFECSSGIGQDPNTALGMAVGGVIFSLMSSVSAMLQKKVKEIVTAELAGKKHRFCVYLGDMVSQGEFPPEKAEQEYWNALKDGIVKRIGNQKLCYVKVYGASYDGKITGECRINDIAVPELGAVVTELVRTWKIDGFGWKKQFFFLQQEEETRQPYPWTEEELAEKTVQAAILFHQCQPEQYQERLRKLIGDLSLAAEFAAFLPELCAENAVEPGTVSEKVFIHCQEEIYPVYKTQLASYETMKRALFRGFAEGTIPEEVYSELITVSLLYQKLFGINSKQIQEKKEAEIVLSFDMPKEYEIR